MIFKIDDREVELRYTLRAIMLYENIQGKSFAPESTTDILVFMFCVIMASDKEIKLDFDKFLDMLDENPSLVVEFSEWLTNEVNKNNTLSPEEEKKVKAELK